METYFSIYGELILGDFERSIGEDDMLVEGQFFGFGEDAYVVRDRGIFVSF